MKNFFLLLMFLCGIPHMIAGEYRTLDLLGTWELTEREGTNPLMRSIENGHIDGPVRYMYLGEFSHETHPSWVYQDDHSRYEYYFLGALTAFNPDESGDYYDYWGISAFWISDDENLHILGADGYNDCNESFFFVIESMTGSEMKLRTFDNKIHLTFRRISGPEHSRTAEISPAAGVLDGIYTLDGKIVRHPGDGIYIIKGEKETKKIIR